MTCAWQLGGTHLHRCVTHSQGWGSGRTLFMLLLCPQPRFSYVLPKAICGATLLGSPHCDTPCGFPLSSWRTGEWQRESVPAGECSAPHFWFRGEFKLVSRNPSLGAIPTPSQERKRKPWNLPLSLGQKTPEPTAFTLYKKTSDLLKVK